MLSHCVATQIAFRPERKGVQSPKPPGHAPSPKRQRSLVVLTSGSGAPTVAPPDGCQQQRRPHGGKYVHKPRWELPNVTFPACSSGTELLSPPSALPFSIIGTKGRYPSSLPTIPCSCAADTRLFGRSPHHHHIPPSAPTTPRPAVTIINDQCTFAHVDEPQSRSCFSGTPAFMANLQHRSPYHRGSHSIIHYDQRPVSTALARWLRVE